jgi:Spy/CpxP family protein refolding chaperone
LTRNSYARKEKAMRKLLLTVALIGLIALPVFAQRGRGGMGRGGMGMGMLIGNAEVQKEIKLTDEQKAALKPAQDELRKTVGEAMRDMDFDAVRKANEAFSKEVASKLKPEQVKRLKQIELQNLPGLAAYTREDVQKALKLTDKQKETIKETAEDLQKDTREIFQDAAGDKEKMRDAFAKIQKLQTEARGKVTKTFTEEQKAAWKDMTGAPFTVRFTGFGGRGKGKGGKDKDKDK